MTTAKKSKSSIAVRNATTGRYVGAAKTAGKASLKGRVAAATPRTADAVVQVASRVAGSRAAGERWYQRPNDLLGGRTPKQAVQDGDGERVVGLLLNVAGQ